MEGSHCQGSHRSGDSSHQAEGPGDAYLSCIDSRAQWYSWLGTKSTAVIERLVIYVWIWPKRESAWDESDWDARAQNLQRRWDIYYRRDSCLRLGQYAWIDMHSASLARLTRDVHLEKSGQAEDLKFSALEYPRLHQYSRSSANRLSKKYIRYQVAWTTTLIRFQSTSIAP